MSCHTISLISECFKNVFKGQQNIINPYKKKHYFDNKMEH